MDKQDELVRLIAEATNLRLFSADVDISHHAASPYKVEVARRYALDAARPVAAAVRSFMGSDEAVERAAKAHCDHFGGEGWWETGLLRDTLPEGRKAMRAAIRTALGGDGDR